MSVTWQTDSEAVMENSRFRDELLFQVSMKMARSMLKQGMISEKDYKEIRQVFLEKYDPPTGTLLSEIGLT